MAVAPGMTAKAALFFFAIFVVSEAFVVLSAQERAPARIHEIRVHGNVAIPDDEDLQTTGSEAPEE